MNYGMKIYLFLNADFVHVRIPDVIVCEFIEKRRNALQLLKWNCGNVP